MRNGFLLAVGALALCLFVLPYSALADLGAASVVRGLVVGLLTGWLVWFGLGYAFGWRARAIKTFRESEAKIAQQLERDKKLG